MARNKIELNHIALEIHNPRRYLDVLSHAVKSIPFYSPVLREAIIEARGGEPISHGNISRDTVMRVLGFVDHELIAVLDREWQDTENNEANRLFEYASSHQLFACVTSVFLWGAGSCRLADHLGSLEFIDEITCSDISWPALHFGRALIQADYDALPDLLTKSRIFYHVDPGSTALIRTSKQSRFMAPLTPPHRRHRIRYAVRDAFSALDGPIAADLIVVPYLLDNFRGAQCISLLIRICQRLQTGQQIVILMTCIAEGRVGPGRDPSLMVDVLGRCGFEIQFVDMTFLPYSFSYYSYGQMHTDWTTLVVRARKIGRGGDIVIAKSDRFDEFQANRPETDKPHRPSTLDRILGRPGRAEPYQAMAVALAPEMGALDFENAVGELIARGLIDLRVERSPLG